jgi:hypothetical protein
VEAGSEGNGGGGMKIFTGDSSGRKTLKVLKDNGIGRFFIRGPRKLYDDEEWGFDNGAFGWWKEGRPFDEDAFMRRLDKCYHGTPYAPYLAVLPDIVAGGNVSWDFSIKWLNSGKLPAEWPWYLAVQDDMETARVINVIDRVAGIFLGGSDSYKMMAMFWRKVTGQFGKPLHYGRAGTLGKIAHASMCAVDSLDSAFPLWTHQRLSSFVQMLSQQLLWVPENYLLLQKLPHRGEGAYGGCQSSAGKVEKILQSMGVEK